MDDTGFPESTSKLCWFSLSSLFFKSSNAPESQALQQSPASSPVRRRTSPRLSNKKSKASPKSSPIHSPLANQCCLLSKSTVSSSAETNCKSVPVTANNSSQVKKQRQAQYSAKEYEDDSEVKSSSVSNGLYEHRCQGHRHQQSSDFDNDKLTHGLSIKEAPHYLTFNPWITGGYRNNLSPSDCIKSLFWWTNETLNIWTHLLGWTFFFSLSVYDVLGLSNLQTTQPWDQTIFSLLLVCFQACMILSASYHVFCCCSERSYRQWLSMDLLGVSLCLLAIYISGIYYAFSCVPSWLNFYLSTVVAIFVSCITFTFLRKSDGFSNRLILYGGWACYGIIPTVHWAILHGSSTAVALLLPRIFWMYAISAAAFFFYVSKLPERWKPGLVNYVGSSHQIWHVLIVAALYHWHNTGLIYLNYRAQHPCSEEYPALYPDSS